MMEKVKSFDDLFKEFGVKSMGELMSDPVKIHAIDAEGLQVMKDYINKEYIHQHKPDLSTDRLKQILANVDTWVIQLQTSKPLASKENVSSTLMALRDTRTAISNRIADRANKPAKQPEYKTLKEIFISEAAYNSIMTTLSEESMTDGTVWCDFSSGYKTKIAALLNDLFYKGYYNVPQMPTPKTFMSIAQNTIKVDVSARTFHSDKIPEYRKEYFYFIEKYRPE